MTLYHLARVNGFVKRGTWLIESCGVAKKISAVQLENPGLNLTKVKRITLQRRDPE